MSLTDELNNTLLNLRTSIPEIKAALIASTDGMVIAANTGAGDPNRMAAMVATALGLGKKITETFGGGQMEETSVAGSDAQVAIFAAGSKGVLAVVVNKGSNIGLLNIECRSAGKSIASILN